MKRILKHLKETRIGDSTQYIGSTVIFGRNEESWKGRISDMETLSNGKTFCYIKNAISDSGKVQSFDIESKEIIRSITDIEMKHGFYG
jgi:hypothetical protein